MSYTCWVLGSALPLARATDSCSQGADWTLYQKDSDA